MTLESAIARLNLAGKRLEPGHVWLVGAGPGDPGCLTLDALSALDGRKACLLSHHGMIAIGESLDKALALAVEVETLAEMYWRALQIREPEVLSDDEMRTVVEPSWFTSGRKPRAGSTSSTRTSFSVIRTSASPPRTRNRRSYACPGRPSETSRHVSVGRGVGVRTDLDGEGFFVGVGFGFGVGLGAGVGVGVGVGDGVGVRATCRRSAADSGVDRWAPPAASIDLMPNHEPLTVIAVARAHTRT